MPIRRTLRSLIARMARGAALLPALPVLLLAGCRQQPSFADLLAGDAVFPEESRAILALLAQSGTEPGALPLVPEGAAGLRGIRVRNGSVVALGIAGVRDLSPLRELTELQSLAVAGSFESVADLGEPPRLRRLRLSTPERTLRGLDGFRAPRLEELEVRYADLKRAPALGGSPNLRTLRLIDSGLEEPPRGVLPRLELLDLRGNELRSLAGMPVLESIRGLELQGNALTSLDGLPPLPALEWIDLRGNPLNDLSALSQEGFDSLRTVDLRGVGVGGFQGRIVDSLGAGGVRLVTDAPSGSHSSEERETLDRLRAARRSLPGEFVESLPARGGRARHAGGSCRWRAGAFEAPRLDCDRTLGTLEGLLRLELLSVDPALPGYGGGAEVAVRATLSVERGVARVYLRERGDLRESARTIARLTGTSSERPPRGTPLPPAEPGDVYDGYRYGDARPGEPVTISGETSYFGSRVVVWVEAVEGEAEGVRLVLEPR